MTGEGKPGDALADKARDEFDKNRRERDLAIERLRIRSEMRSEHEDEDSAVIDQRALESQRRKPSDPPSGYGKQAAGVIGAVKGWPQAIFGLGLLALLAFVAWLKWH